jgi:hypothetical protein
LSLFFPVLWVTTVFVGAGLLFIAQPMMGKLLLPRAGGAPAVWTTSVLFFQVLLLAGYGYAHWLGRLPRGKQIALHAVVLLLPLGLLPFQEGGVDAARFPSPFWILTALLLAIGAPFFVLSANTPLLQNWIAGTRLPAAKDPYFLYAASNAGSLIALCAYPILVEPRLGLERQRDLWNWGYAGYAALALACAASFFRARSASEPPGDVDDLDDASPVSSRRRLSWLALTAAPASSMLGITSILTADLSALPFVWVLTLGLYLLTFVLAFSPRALVPPGLPARLLPIAAVVFLLLLLTKATEPVAIVMAAHLAAFFVAALACHTELARLRPHPRRLTTYYALIGLGGAIGGAFNALAAPLLFEGWGEAPLAFVAACLLVPRGGTPLPAGKKKRKEPPGGAIRRSDVAIPIALGLATYLLSELSDALGAEGPARDLLAAGIPVFLTYLASERRVRFGLAVGAVLWAGSLDTALRGEELLADRSFFGIHRVTRTSTREDGRVLAFHRLYHGTTIHGAQRAEADGTSPIEPREPLAYYAPTSPIGRALAVPRERIGLVGLGAGSLLAYGEPGERWSVFEIDPMVLRIAEDRRYFTYLHEARKRGVEIEVILGDARLTLPSAAPGLDLLVLDAFTSGSIPVHLLTREAFDLYLSKLGPEGVLAFHISNRHLDLAPLMRAMARDLDLAVAVVDGPPDPGGASTSKLGSRWAFLARSKDALRALGLFPEPSSSSGAGIALWTDDRSDLWSLFQW